MRTLIALYKKELLEQIRTKKFLILGLLFIFFGIMNPLTAKLTPMLLELFADSMENSGINITVVEVTALDSWMQFFKNLPVVLIAYLLIQSGIFAKEYQKGTLNLVLTKGVEKYKVLLSKITVLIDTWTAGYLIYFIVTYAYTIYYWDNSIVNNLMFSVFIWWLFGILVIVLFTLFSSFIETSGSALALTGGWVLVLYVISLISKITKFIPITLIDCNSLIYGLKEVSYYIPSLIITFSLIVVCSAVSFITFSKKKI